MAQSQQGERTQARRTGAAGEGREAAGQAAQGGHQGVPAAHDSHGQSLASWTAVGMIMLGALIMCIAVVVTTPWLFVVGAVVAVGGAVAGKVLSAMGFGVSGKPSH